jgi:L-rhamnonate dehydratase
MQITEIRIVELTGSIDDPEVYWEERSVHPADHYPELRRLREAEWPKAGDMPYRARVSFVEVVTESGLIGTGGPIIPEQAWVIQRRLAPLLIGADALATERLWEIMYRSCAAHGRKGLEMLAISVLDCALWDLKGRHFGVPVWRLLGGPTRERVPVYISTLGTSVEPERASATAARLVVRGFQGMKWFPRFGPADGMKGLRRNVELVRVLRGAVGDDVRLMIDAWMSWDVPYTLEFAELAADYDLHWIEDPVMPERLDSFAELNRRLGNRPQLASGERTYTRWEFEQLAAAGVRVLQPEVFWSGGLSELLKMAALASVRPVTLIPHGTSLPTSAHFAFAQPPTLVPMLEYLHRPNLTWQWFFADPVLPQDGYIYPPQRPGLGMDFDESKIESRRELRCE